MTTTTDSETQIRADERATLREWIYGKQIDLTWWGVKDIEAGSEPRPWGRQREAHNRGLMDVLDMLDQRDRDAGIDRLRDEVSAAHDHDCTALNETLPASPLAEPWNEGERP